MPIAVSMMSYIHKKFRRLLTRRFHYKVGHSVYSCVYFFFPYKFSTFRRARRIASLQSWVELIFNDWHQVLEHSCQIVSHYESLWIFGNCSEAVVTAENCRGIGLVQTPSVGSLLLVVSLTIIHAFWGLGTRIRWSSHQTVDAASVVFSSWRRRLACTYPERINLQKFQFCYNRSLRWKCAKAAYRS